MVETLDRPARQRWSTADVDSRRALAYWVDTICKSFLEIDIESPQREHFAANLDQLEFGPATLYIIEAQTQTIRRTLARIAQSRYAGYFLLQLRAGRLHFRQYGRESRIEAGDCVLVDCGAPYWLECPAYTRSVALRFSQDWLKNWIPAPERLAGHALRSDQGWSKTLAAALENLDRTQDEGLALPTGVVAEQIAALLALAAGPELQATRGTDKLLTRIRHTMRDRCNEPGLSPAAVAAAHGISKRYLHYLFSHASTTFCSELMKLRLESAHRLLSDQRYAALSVSEISARCGFLEPSHFARRFRKAYQLGPAEFRIARNA